MFSVQFTTIFAPVNHILTIMTPFSSIGNVPFDLNVLATIFPNCKHVNEKARALETAGRIARLKKGLYVALPNETGKGLSLGLIANHLYGPSYVSRHTALRHYGLTPEAVYLTQSITTKHSRNFSNSIGHFQHQNCSPEYFPIGIRIVKEDGVSYLMATPEKALCDTINFSKSLHLRFMKDVAIYLEEDIRFDTDAIADFNLEILEQCAEFSRKQQSIKNLIKYIKHEYHI